MRSNIGVHHWHYAGRVPAPPLPSRPSPAELAARLRALPPSLGPVRLIGIDGYAGSGKSTLAARLAAALDGAPVIHLDDLASHDALFGWMPRLTAQILDPLARGAEARYEVYDWERRGYTRTAVVPPAPVVLLEGWGPGGGHCAAGSPISSGWTSPASAPGRPAGAGTGPRRPPSGAAGRPRNAATSTMIRPDPRRIS